MDVPLRLSRVNPSCEIDDALDSIELNLRLVDRDQCLEVAIPFVRRWLEDLATNKSGIQIEQRLFTFLG